MIIDKFDGENFSGTVTDYDDENGTGRAGVVEGKIFGAEIQFVNKMTMLIGITPTGRRTELNRKHNLIYYSGKLLSDNTYEGTWKIKAGIRFNKLKSVFISFGTNGSWEMKKIN